MDRTTRGFNSLTNVRDSGQNLANFHLFNDYAVNATINDDASSNIDFTFPLDQWGCLGVCYV